MPVLENSPKRSETQSHWRDPVRLEFSRQLECAPLKAHSRGENSSRLTEALRCPGESSQREREFTAAVATPTAFVTQRTLNSQPERLSGRSPQQAQEKPSSHLAAAECEPSREHKREMRMNCEWAS